MAEFADAGWCEHFWTAVSYSQPRTGPAEIRTGYCESWKILTELSSLAHSFTLSWFLRQLITKSVWKAFYDQYFRAAEWIVDLEQIEAVAQIEAAKSGLAAMDALHIAAAHLGRADEFITTERSGKPIYRSSLITAIYAFD